MKALKRIVIAVLALGALQVPISSAGAAGPAPAWRLRMVALPTNLAPGSEGERNFGPVYMLVATNVGGALAGPVNLSATFPSGVAPIFSADAPLGEDRDSSSPDPVCSTVPSQTVTCTAAGPVRPGRPVFATIPVKVTAPSGAVLPNVVASVSSPGASPVTTKIPITIDAEPPPFGFLPGSQGLATLFTQADGLPSLAAGSHPDQLTINLGFPVEQPVVDGPTTSAGHPRDIVTDLPQGVVVNPNATAKTCTELQLLEEQCPAESQVGLVTVVTDTLGPRPEFSQVYNMKAPPGSPAMFAFEAAGTSKAGVIVHVTGGVRSEGDFGLYAESTDILARDTSPLEDFQLQLWGHPADSSHDQVRGECVFKPSAAPCSVTPRDTPLLTMPSACSETLTTAARARSWEEENAGIEELGHEARAESTDVTGNPVGVSECSTLKFSPTLTVRPETGSAQSPSGVEIKLSVPQAVGREKATSTLKGTVVTFPKGLAANAAAAGGQKACSPAEIGMLTGVGETPVHLSDEHAKCLDASKIGTLEVSTPVLDHTLPGAVYLAEPYQNPFGTLLAAYLVIDSPQDGLVTKLASKIEADPETGQLTASVEDAPQLPISEVKINLFGGPRSAMRTPITCGAFTTRSVLTPWSGQPPVEKTDSFQMTRGPSGRPCVSSEAEMPNHPGFEAGTATPLAGAYSPFLGRLTRDDGEQQLKSFNATLPPGLTGKLAGVGTCSDAAIATARSKSGQQELTSPSCPASSLIGQVEAGAGAGPDPYYTTGKIYMAGPYKGAPLSAVAITPAVAGPFDLGNVVIQVPTYLDPVTAVLSVKNGEEFPHILKGIPLELRDARISLNRNQFTLNPTSCSPKAITGQAISLLGNIAPLFERFQVGGCKGLDYEPKLFIRLKGGTKRGAHPSLRAVLEAKPGQEANTAKTSVALPRSEFLENAHIQTVCTRVQFAAEQCPKGAIYGSAKAITPLLDEPLEGPVYLRSSSHELPDMVAALKGPPSRPIKIELAGRIDSVNGGIRSTFDFVPDQPVTKFILSMKGGKKGLIINSRDICAHTYRAQAKFDGQNSKTHDFRPELKASCGGKKKVKKASRK
jgi:hypothetical protein